ncbi:hypothetical protein FM106_14125 [Brachybacterium faecium]|nr:hypothetical protein FM106_14125 [Brachybacterium faecium]
MTKHNNCFYNAQIKYTIMLTFLKKVPTEQHRHHLFLNEA